MFYLYLILAWVVTFVTGIFADCNNCPEFNQNTPHVCRECSKYKPEASSFTIFCFCVGLIWWFVCLFCKEDPLWAFGPYAAATAINIIRLLNFTKIIQFIGKVGP